jgi:ribosomal protein S18 acetylase RimI-like enzyme
MYIERVSEVTGELYEALERLIPQLSPSKTPPTREELSVLIKSEGSSLLIARYPDESGEIAGLLSLTVYRVPTGIRSIVEDVVIDETMRRRGIGQALVEHAIKLAREAGASVVSLTSNPKREAANYLYQSLGFERRGTNVYSYKLK